ncbi:MULTISPECIES: glutamate synthase large subunit [unclassified Azospirillum]|uniref:glutamate synthase large subunit n=1 Tax=unclassified Azospirillum TaxID=2630922 RepID=UPI000B74D814|nr:MULTISPECIES: glutamate synthase large subunit [unclassified Azospirillum]SNR90373.1 glutamate synthase (NADPH) large subunit [Azospirillum sp. RU38E]SNS06340.1 glutamate synthase (NADPH) large subunit [Azospirillum sp. RU37A]
MTDANLHAGEIFAAEYTANKALLDNTAFVDTEQHDACGVGFVAAIDGKPRREVVEKAVEALRALWHRGAVDADGKTGDGAGIHVQLPQAFFREHVVRTGHPEPKGLIAVGQVFLPRTDLSAQERCRAIVETEVLNWGYTIYGWRQVPIDISIIGEKANATRPEIEQIMVGNPKQVPEDQFERDLYIIRRRIEKAVAGEQIGGFYICTLSARSIIYKGMFLAEQLTAFYPDLLDERFESNFAVYHQRYSTNTFPTWQLAQPFRTLAHNGEINTLRGNVNWMKAHETRMDHEVFGANVEDLKPIIPVGSSDSGALDAVFELMVKAGRSAPMVKTMLVPEAWSNKEVMPQAHRDLYSYANSVMEPWDGPAALAIYDGRWVVGGVDRNGLRPLRYVITGDGLIIGGSEAGMVKINEQAVVEKGRLGPGQMIAVDLVEGRLFHDREIKDNLAAQRPYGNWIGNITVLDDLVKKAPVEPAELSKDELRRRQLAYGITMEDLELILQPMVDDAKEAVGSMGDDSPIAVLSDKYRGLHHYFRQNFAQVTNPPIDSLRETRVMSLKTRLGNLGNILDEDAGQCRLLQLESPVLTTAEFRAMRKYMGATAAEIDCTFDASAGPNALRDGLRRIRQEAEDAVRGGATHVILTDEAMSGTRAPMPMILATGAVHTHLIRQQLRTFTSLNVRSGECLDVHYFAVLIGVGATTVNAYIAQEAIADRHRRGLFGQMSLEECLKRYKKAINDGLLKVMSKMGISIISSYRGGLNFEAIGLSRSLAAEYFPGLPSRISGLGLLGIQEEVLGQHKMAYDEDVVALPVGGFYRFRKGGDRHAWEGGLIHMMQTAVSTDSFSTFKKYSEALHKRPPINLRDLLDFKPAEKSVPVDEVESITSLRKRFITPGMSLGALSPEAHGTLNVAMNRIGARSVSGEGGEDPARFKPDANGDNWNSAIKQVASGRFGVTAEYLNQCREIEIKVAQGAKPGEGGQLPGFKVTELIAKLRHSTPGVMLISPPPHHDIYSIEDLAQLIYDLKQVNPIAKVCVKLVSRSGIGTIAAGVAKAGADIILVAGHNGGTGASPQTSVKYAGVPWEMGLSEVQQVLTLNRLRHRVTLRTDGGLKTGRDIVMAAMLGAEEFGIGTAALVAMGCIMVRQCHSNTCPVGVCVQDEDLRKKFTGTPEKVVNLFSFIAEEVREILANLGFRELREVVGRSDLLHQVSRGAAHLDDLDLNPLLSVADPGEYARYCTLEGRNEVPDTLDAQMIKDARALFEDGEKTQMQYHAQNTHRAIGTALSGMITRKFGMKGLQPGHATVRLRGSAGQSLGAFAVQGLKLEVFGDANDYVGKGLSGGTIVVRPLTASPLKTNENTIIGNTVLYGATAGKLFAAGQAGERFAVRNSGATVVVEGCGSNGCEYMTGGLAVILGPVGDNFGAGMTGGMAYVYDEENRFPLYVNPESVIYQRLEVPHYEEQLKALIQEHVDETGSRWAAQLLNDWELVRGQFWQVVPKEMLHRLAVPVTAPERLSAE